MEKIQDFSNHFREKIFTGFRGVNKKVHRRIQKQ